MVSVIVNTPARSRRTLATTVVPSMRYEGLVPFGPLNQDYPTSFPNKVSSVFARSLESPLCTSET